jgi:hypothetical protein
MNISIKQWHRLSGIVIASFLLLHITNHLFALGGPALHIAVMKVFRHVYRFLPLEIILLACVGFQVISGITLVFKKGFSKQPFYVVVQVVSGLYLSFFMLYHVRAVMMGRYAWHTETDFYYAAGGASHYPASLFFIPYYSLSLVCVFAHIACVHYIKRMEFLERQRVCAVDAAIFRRKYKRETIGICITGGLVTVLIMIAFSGVLFHI